MPGAEKQMRPVLDGEGRGGCVRDVPKFGILQTLGAENYSHPDRRKDNASL